MPKEQQILQAEYLSQVLYDKIEVPDSANPPLSRFGTGYSGMNSLPTIANHLHNVTAPISGSEKPIQQALEHPGCHLVSVPRALERSTSEHQLHLRTAVSLRGGYTDIYIDNPAERNGDGLHNFEENAKLKRLCAELLHANALQVEHKSTLLSRPFTTEFPWVREVCRHPQWHAPISSGASYDAFAESLATVELGRFGDLFGPKPAFLSASVATARRVFFTILTAPQKQVFKNMITSKGMSLLALVENGAGAQCISPPKPQDCISKPIVLLEHLLEATEGPEVLSGSTHTSLLPESSPDFTSWFVGNAPQIDLSTEHGSYAFIEIFML